MMMMIQFDEDKDDDDALGRQSAGERGASAICGGASVVPRSR